MFRFKNSFQIGKIFLFKKEKNQMIFFNEATNKYCLLTIVHEKILFYYIKYSIFNTQD